MKVIVALKDTAARVFGTPFFVQAAAQAVRSLRDEVNSGKAESDLARHPSDFELYDIGSYDEDSGVITMREPSLICRAKDLKESV
ncbi:MAG: nonstructural protein [Microviridae sp.]|nr:MAG: nonstructural protein [Microviridae sp.]